MNIMDNYTGILIIMTILLVCNFILIIVVMTRQGRTSTPDSQDVLVAKERAKLQLEQEKMQYEIDKLESERIREIKNAEAKAEQEEIDNLDQESKDISQGF